MDQNSSYHWSNRTVQQLISYEALFKLLDEIQPLDDINEISQRVAKQWKYFANVTAWHLVIEDKDKYLVIDGFHGEATMITTSLLSSWDTHYFQTKIPGLFPLAKLPESPRPPEHLINKAITEISVIPFMRMNHCIGLLSVAARHEPFSDLDKKFIRTFGAHLTDQIFGILLRQHNMSTLLNKATYDDLTGILNRRSIIERLEMLLPTSKRTAEPISIILGDIDHFKQVNDNYGHLVGDIVLKEVSRILQEKTRRSDHMGRYGGEEFLFVLFPCDSNKAIRAAERLRISIENNPILIDEHSNKEIQITISLGIATIQDSDEKIGTLLSRADKALYTSKNEGRNRSTFSK